MLDPLNKEHVPSDLAIEESVVDLDGVMVFRDNSLVDALEPGGLLSFPRAYRPPPMELSTIQALRAY
jgi:hypothetical protein